MPTRFVKQARSSRQSLTPSKATPAPTTNSILAAAPPQMSAAMHSGLLPVANEAPGAFDGVLQSRVHPPLELISRTGSNTNT
ncbi:MAG: hypothetical protein F4X14_00110 [Caldilineaceae bacterium SB0661_bin_32]|uniref:Uncharacterized protein n=1 Tax=Caldilineaceae bacterium SB0661_bin_32 TaxID=2605255 RepID=A0A6B1D1B4_9CHLR|nr:hypothetical protein [Caldilineaceae bacterium SB0661_bin_32]